MHAGSVAFYGIYFRLHRNSYIKLKIYSTLLHYQIISANLAPKN